MRLIEILWEYFTYFDLYGRNVDLYIDNSTKLRSKFSACFSLMIIISSLLFLSTSFKSWSENRNLQIISSSTAFNVDELLSLDQPIKFTFNYTNYHLYIALYAILPNGTFLNYDALQRYLIHSFSYRNTNRALEALPFNKCSIYQQRKFLELEEGIEAYLGKYSNNTSCLENGFEMGLFPDVENRMINIPEVIYDIKKCSNTTENNNFCASEQEINDILPYVQVQMTIPKTIYDFNNPFKPRKRTYDFQFYSLDQNLMKIYNNKLIPVYLKTDIGVIQDEIVLDCIDFNVDRFFSEVKLRSDGDNSALFSYNLEFGANEVTYYRRNEKIYQIVGNFGGVINILFLFGRILCYYYNLLVLKYKLINMSFENLENLENSSRSTGNFNLFKKNEKNFKFSLFSILFPKLSSMKIYDEALNNLYEYMDIHKIILRLQDIDKLKLILFDDNQRKIFDTLPKPGIGGKNSHHHKSILTMENIMKPRKTNDLTISLRRLAFLFNGENINNKLLEMIDPKLKKEIKAMNESQRLSVVSQAPQMPELPLLSKNGKRFSEGKKGEIQIEKHLSKWSKLVPLKK